MPKTEHITDRLAFLHLSHAQVEQAVKEFVERRTGFICSQVIVGDAYWRTRTTTDAVVKVNQ